jgi:phosphate/sulfate permease
MGKISQLIIVFIGVMVAIPLMIAIANSLGGQTDSLTMTNETLDISGARLDNNNINSSYPLTLTYDEWISITEINNGSQAFTATTDYVYETNRTTERIYFQNTTATVNNVSNTTYVIYSYYPDDYVYNATARVILPLILIFLAIAILLGSVLYGYRYIKEL